MSRTPTQKIQAGMRLLEEQDEVKTEDDRKLMLNML
jgi:hypothetical protein